MKLPHFIRYVPKIANLTGHNGVTVLFWTFVNIPRVSPEFVRHEYRHTVQWTILTALGVVLMAVLAVLDLASWWQLPMGVLLFPICYFISSAFSGYHNNWFEKDARKYAASRDD